MKRFDFLHHFTFFNKTQNFNENISEKSVILNNLHFFSELLGVLNIPNLFGKIEQEASEIRSRRNGDQ